MEKDSDIFEVSELIQRWLSGEITPGEEMRLEEWKNRSDDNRRLFGRICSSGTASRKIAFYDRVDTEKAFDSFLKEKRAWEKKQQHTRRNVGRMWPWMAAAGMVAVAVGIFCLWKMQTVETGSQVAGGVAISAKPENTVRLISASGQVFRLDTMTRFDGESVMAENKAGELVFSPKQKDLGTSSYTVVEVPVGGEYKLLLTDGTEVYLNAETSFRFPENFGSDGDREVYLSGEAYFRVTRTESRPFVVHTDGAYVRVLGTTFNVKAYPGENLQQTTLVSGSVVMGADGADGEVMLKPGMLASYDKGKKMIDARKVDVSYYIAWKDGVFAFREKRLEEVMEILSRWYGFTFFFQNPEIRDYIYTGKLPRHGTVEEVFRDFTMTGDLNFSVNKDIVVINTKN